MLDILILDDTRDGAETLKQALLFTDKTLTVEATASHEAAFKILSEKRPLLLIMEPNFHGENLKHGKIYLSHIKERFPDQAVALTSASSLSDDDMKFFKDHGVSVFLSKLSTNKLEVDCRTLINEAKKSG